MGSNDTTTLTVKTASDTKVTVTEKSKSSADEAAAGGMGGR